MKKKILTLLLVLVLVLAAAAGGTLAYLQDATEEVKNEFTTSDVDIDLTETTGSAYRMIPGYTIAKDPMVTVKANSEKCYVFVQVTESSTGYNVNSTLLGFDDYLTYAINETKWTELKDEENQEVSGVYYKVFDSAQENQTEYILEDNKVTVKSEVTKAMMDAIDQENVSKPTLTFKAYACQYMKNNTEFLSPLEAWAIVSS